MKKTIALILFVFILQVSYGTTHIAIVNNGNWSKNTTWSDGKVPTYGDSVNIPINFLVNFDLSQNQSYPDISLAPLSILVQGTLYFPSGKKLALPCGSRVYVVGWVRAQNTTGGTNNQSNIIDICNQTMWYSGMGDITGKVISYNSPLPINISSFNAECDGKVKITWSTITETNNEFFTLERSIDAINWFEVARIPGAGNSNALLSYQYKDENSLEGISYYRLTQTDFDGKFKTFSPVAVTCSATQTSELTMYPNPFKNDLAIHYYDQNAGKGNVSVYNMVGSLVALRTVEVVPGSNDFIIDLSDLSVGLYNVEFTVGTTSYHQKVIKN
ncbi:MAG: T9SS type A sorting domain-containing protein [Bacteroidota bacterium]